jgi:O-antigen/teichoic acid export membrane protein
MEWILMMTDDGLRSKTTKAIGYLGIGGVLVKLVSLGNTLVLANLLSPADYGLMAMAMMVLGFIGFLNEVGIGAAIVQKEDLTTSEVNGCFAIALLASMVLFGSTVLASGLIADFFKSPQLQSMISVLAIDFIFGAISTVPLAFLRKKMDFRAIASLTMLNVLLQSAINLYLVMTGHGVWSLVWGFIAANLASSIGAVILSGWRPKGRYGLREASGLVIYGLHVTLSRIFWYLYTNADKAIIGRLLGPKYLGIYEMAFSLATLPSSQVTSLVVNVASPLFSTLQNDHSRLNSVILKLTRAVTYVTYPALIGMLACSRELISVTLGPKWLEVLIPFGALCITGIIKSIDPLLTQALTSTGHVKKVSFYTGMCGVLMSLALVAGALLDGLRGVSLAWVMIYPLLSIKLLSDVCRLTGMKMLDYYKNIVPALTASIVMGLVVLLIREICLNFSLLLPLSLAIEIFGGIVTYVLWVVYIDFYAIGEIRQVMIDAGFSERNFNRWPFNRAAAL